MRARHLSHRTEEAYVAWIRRFILFHGKRHPAEMGAPEVTTFLTGTMLPGLVKTDLGRHLAEVRAQHQRDLAAGAGWVELPTALLRKYPNAGREWTWQWVFPGTRICRDRLTDQRRRHHLHESVLQRAATDAVRRAGSPSVPAPTRCATRSRPTCSRTATTSWPSRSCWGTGT